MYDLLIYSLKTGACLAVFYLFFKLLLCRDTFHRFNRVVVLMAIAASFLLPVWVVTVYREVPLLPELPIDLLEYAEKTDFVPAPVEKSFPWEALAGGLFLLGVVGVLVRLAVSTWAVWRIIRRNPSQRLADGTVLVRCGDQVKPFSWWRYVVIAESDIAECGAEILIHERAHLRLHHSLDLLVVDLAASLQWFNPAIWLLRRELREIHEFEADQAVLNEGVDARQYQILLIKKAVGGRWYSVANSFNHSKLKNRITMMLRKRSSRWAKIKALLVLPLVGFAVGAFAQTVYVVPTGDKDTKKNVEVKSIVVQPEGVAITICGVSLDTLPADKRPLILVDGHEATSLQEVPADKIASIDMLDKQQAADQGYNAPNGLVKISLRKEGDPMPDNGSTVNVTMITNKEGEALNDKLNGAISKIVVVGSKDGEFSQGKLQGTITGISNDGFAPRSYTIRLGSQAQVGKEPVIMVNGKRSYSKMEEMKPEDIIEVVFFKGGANYPDGVIYIRTRNGMSDAEWSKIISQVTVDHTREQAEKVTITSAGSSGTNALKAAESSLETARKGLELARERMSEEEWNKIQAQLEEAQGKIDAARQQAVADLSAASVADGKLRAETIVMVDKRGGSDVQLRISPENPIIGKLLYVVDGKKESSIDNIQPNLVASITVLKDSTAVAQYGKQAANGVVIVTTKLSPGPKRPKAYISAMEKGLKLVADADIRNKEITDRQYATQAEYDADLAAVNSRYARAVPLFERAAEIAPDQKFPIEMLNQLCFRLRDLSPEMLDKYRKYKELLASMK